MLRVNDLGRILLGAVWLTLAACTTSTGESDVQTELNRNRSLWKSQDVGDYRYTVQHLCFCPEELTRPVRVEVRGGSVAERTVVETNAAPDPRGVELWPSVEGLFEVVQEAIDRNAAQITVEYDASFGYPTSIRIDYDTRIADEERSFRASDLQPLR